MRHWALITGDVYRVRVARLHHRVVCHYPGAPLIGWCGTLILPCVRLTSANAALATRNG